MTTLSTRLAAAADRLTTKYGESVTFHRETGGTFDPATGTTTGATTSNFAVNASPMEYRNDQIDGERIRAGDVMLIIPLDGYTPVPGDSVTYAGADWYAVDVLAWRAQGVDVGYKVQVRK